MSKTKKRTRTNKEITADQVRLIGADGQQIGVVGIKEALQGAEEANLDLVEISPNVDPPVCRIMDYGKYRFDQSKRQSAGKKKQKRTQIKEIKFRPVTDVGDYNVKLRNLKKFLQHGDKVKVTVRFRGREMLHRDLGLSLLQRVEEDLLELGIVEQHPRAEGRQITMVMTPVKT